MSVTIYDPDDYLTAGNTAIVIAPAVASILAPKISEYNAGTKVDCAIENFGTGTDASTISRKKLCDKIATETVGSRKYTVEDTVVVMSNPQAANTFMSGMTLDAIKYILVRPGLAHDAAAAVAQSLWVLKVQLIAKDPEPISTEDGNAYKMRLKWAVLDRTLDAVMATG